MLPLPLSIKLLNKRITRGADKRVVEARAGSYGRRRGILKGLLKKLGKGKHHVEVNPTCSSSPVFQGAAAQSAGGRREMGKRPDLPAAPPRPQPRAQADEGRSGHVAL